MLREKDMPLLPERKRRLIRLAARLRVSITMNDIIVALRQLAQQAAPHNLGWLRAISTLARVYLLVRERLGPFSIYCLLYAVFHNLGFL